MTVHNASSKKLPSLSAHCRFDDHIRCVAAKKNLLHKREMLRLAKNAAICDMLDLPTQLTGHPNHKVLQYSKLTIVNKSSPHTPVRSHETSSDHVITSPLVNEEAIQLTSKNDDGSVMLPFNKGVEMTQLGFTATPQSPKQQQLNMYLRSSSFSHEEHHLDQHRHLDQRQQHHHGQQNNSHFNQRQLSVDQQQQLSNNIDQVTKTSNDQRENNIDNEITINQRQSSVDQQQQLSNDIDQITKASDDQNNMDNENLKTTEC